MNGQVFFVALCIAITFALKSTLPTYKRIENLKQQLLKDIENRKGVRSFLNYDGHEYNYDDSQGRDFVVRPIYDDDPLNQRAKVKRIGNNTAVRTTRKTTRGRQAKREGLRLVLNKFPKALERKKERLFNPLDVFYRRVLGVEFKDMEVKWVHCQDMITPYLSGIKKDVSEWKKVDVHNPIVVRLLQLLRTNTTDYSKEEVHSVLYQISKLQLRLFQWDVLPIRVLFNTIIKSGRHTFRNLKKGVREMFEGWRLSLYNATKLLNAARIIRPPCTVTSQYSGSTKSQKVQRPGSYTEG
ncbi:uncharacterized protein [Battus philenor]|uniref:uncharacterized protein n=1 Tax=Battus philenor TaxID=42288 RepID=UPI0035CEC689